MVETRRFGVPMVLVCLGFLVVCVRLFEVQILEHPVWAREAINLGRFATIEPYKRGTIVDCNGEPLAYDVDLYELQFIWREFRREHPLGQVAEARSLLELRTVPLIETLPKIKEWAEALVRLSPKAIDDFGKGQALEVGALVLPETDDREGEQRWSRRGHLHFYIKALLNLSDGASRNIKHMKGEPEWELSYLALAASKAVTELEIDEETVLGELRARLEDSQKDLQALADLMTKPRSRPEGGFDERLVSMELGPALADLVYLIEAARRRVENSSADDLFRSATGFSAARMDVENLRALDLDWLRRGLYWDAARLAEWVSNRGQVWELAARTTLARRVVAEMKIGDKRPSERVVDAFARVFRRAPDSEGFFGWSGAQELVVLSELGTIFAGSPESALLDRQEPLLPFEGSRFEPGKDSELFWLANIFRDLEDHPDLIAALERDSLGGGSSANSAIARLADHFLKLAGSRRETRVASRLDESLVSIVLREWNRRLQERIAHVILELQSSADESHPQRASRNSLTLAEGRIKIASEERDYVVRDRSSRSMRLVREPKYALVRLISRYPNRYEGFVILGSTKRILPLNNTRDKSTGTYPLARFLVGSVRSPYVLDLVLQREEEANLRDLSAQLERSDFDLKKIEEIAGKSILPGTMQGGTGVEGYFDAVLRGLNGYRETLGLQERSVQGTNVPSQDAVDGARLQLTLDLRLQRAAERVLANPDTAPVGEEKPDLLWKARPVGAIVLMTVTGDVLAAASVPTVAADSEASFADEIIAWAADGKGSQVRDGQWRHAYDRTRLRQTAVPPGSIFKPFMALWALHCCGLDPMEGFVTCIPATDKLYAKYGHMHCHRLHGHSARARGQTPVPLALNEALVRSCNCYFAKLGHERFNRQKMLDMTSAFGFGLRTGIRSLKSEYGGRYSLREDYLINGEWEQDDFPTSSTTYLISLANGLSYMNVVPMQVARAYAGLATGTLPEVRLVRDEHVAETHRKRRRMQAIGIEERHFKIVRQALDDVVNRPDGSAYNKGLDAANLGFRLRAKTGSADYRHGFVPDFSESESGGAITYKKGMRKHTWLAGWFPAENPKAVVVIFIHDTSATSGHSAVHLARQFLTQKEIGKWLAEQDARSKGEPQRGFVEQEGR